MKVTGRRRYRAVAAVAVCVSALGATGCGSDATDETLTFRLWDEQAADAYRASFEQFTADTGIDVSVVVVPWADYWSQLRLDIAAGAVDDVFWTNAVNVADYARAGELVAIGESADAASVASWDPAVVEQYTVDGRLWGVPQLTDPGIGLFYNADLLAAAGLRPQDVAALTWDPAADDDPLRAAARQLTHDAEGRTPDAAGFDERDIQQYGYSASNDLNAILLQFLGSNGAAWQDGDRFVFADPAGVQAIEYVVDLIEDEHVAPPAVETNPPTGGDVARELFLRGELALFQTGAYNLASIAESADFAWGIARLPEGPAGAVSVTNGVVAAASAHSDHPDAQRALLEWIGSAEGNAFLGRDGSALPAVTDAQHVYFDLWADRGVDVSPLMEVLQSGVVQPPQGARYGAAEAAMRPLLNEVFLGQRDVADGLGEAERAGNAAMDQDGS